MTEVLLLAVLQWVLTVLNKTYWVKKNRRILLKYYFYLHLKIIASKMNVKFVFSAHQDFSRITANPSFKRVIQKFLSIKDNFYLSPTSLAVVFNISAATYSNRDCHNSSVLVDAAFYFLKNLLKRL